MRDVVLAIPRTFKNYNLTGWLPDESHGPLPRIVRTWQEAEQVALQWVQRLGASPTRS